jgi:hypothetical protein
VPVTTFCAFSPVIPSLNPRYFKKPENTKIPKNIIRAIKILFDNPGLILYYFGIFYLSQELQLVGIFINNDLLKVIFTGLGGGGCNICGGTFPFTLLNIIFIKNWI